ncbi:hypothetical protein QBC36DRAFT_54984 [Triangularia setosa]|uniref:Secreted protein n=1 Tax=Triangularia setosa TaxID=2587417 RepID=A0AAN7A334_9PEZI|nr:hypothetical protein QBC36DRAFT_54984 [Podospora setosa]
MPSPKNALVLVVLGMMPRLCVRSSSIFSSIGTMPLLEPHVPLRPCSEAYQVAFCPFLRMTFIISTVHSTESWLFNGRPTNIPFQYDTR